jgi:hypothetical protein
MFCQNCGAFDTDEAKFCSRCGESLSEAPKRERFPLLRIWKCEAFRGWAGSLMSLSDSHQASLRMLRSFCGLFILSAALFAFLIIVTGSGSGLRVGLITLLMFGIVAFLFMVMCGRILRELDSVTSRVGNPGTSMAEKPESQDQKDQIEWNIE